MKMLRKIINAESLEIYQKAPLMKFLVSYMPAEYRL